MNKKIRQVFYTCGAGTAELAEKFLSNPIFCTTDLCYWIDPEKGWCENKRDALNLLTCLLSQNCCKQISQNHYETLLKFTSWLELLRKVFED